MTPETLTNLKTEIENLRSLNSTYGKGVSDFLSGASTTCPHFAESVAQLSNDIALSIVSSSLYSGQGSSYGAIVDVVYDVSATQRSLSVLNMGKAAYYAEQSSFNTHSDNYITGESARTVSYITGKSPDQGVLI